MVLMHRISPMIEALLQRAIWRLSRRLEDLAVDIEEPTVIAAPNSLLPYQAKLQRCPAMGTVQL
jgi:hypothetical protein